MLSKVLLKRKNGRVLDEQFYSMLNLISGVVIEIHLATCHVFFSGVRILKEKGIPFVYNFVMSLIINQVNW